MPAAFSLPQNQIDTILRSGGGRDSMKMICLMLLTRTVL